MELPWTFSWLGYPLDRANEARAAFEAEFWLDGKMLPREGSAELIAAPARRQQFFKAEYEIAPPDFWDDFWDEFIFVEEDEPESHSGGDTEPSEMIVLRKKNILLKDKIA